MSFFSGVHPFGHYQWVVSEKDAHGNQSGALADVPVPRMAIALYQTGDSQTREPVTVEHAALYVSRLTMLVEDASVFDHRDEVTIGGTRFEVDGRPADGNWQMGPFPILNAIFGAEIRLKRVG